MFRDERQKVSEGPRRVFVLGETSRKGVYAVSLRKRVRQGLESCTKRKKEHLLFPRPLRLSR